MCLILAHSGGRPPGASGPDGARASSRTEAGSPSQERPLRSVCLVRRSSWKDFFSTDGGRLRRLREVEAVAWCAGCRDVRLNRFIARANFALAATSRNGGYDWHCPICGRFYEWNQAAQCFVDITAAWLEDFSSSIHCGTCGGWFGVEAQGGACYRCHHCGQVVQADLRQILLAAQDPLA